MHRHLAWVTLGVLSLGGTWSAMGQAFGPDPNLQYGLARLAGRIERLAGSAERYASRM